MRNAFQRRGALQLFDCMRQQGLRPGVITYMAIIRACGNTATQREPCSSLEDAACASPVLSGDLLCIYQRIRMGRMPERALRLIGCGNGDSSPVGRPHKRSPTRRYHLQHKCEAEGQVPPHSHPCMQAVRGRAAGGVWLYTFGGMPGISIGPSEAIQCSQSVGW